MFNLLSVLPSVCWDVHTRLKMTTLRDFEVASVRSKIRIIIV